MLQAVYVFDSQSDSFTGRVVAIDIGDGVPTVANSVGVDGIPATVTLTPDRTRVLVSQAYTSGNSGPATTTVTVLDSSAFIDNPNTAPTITGAPSVATPLGPNGAVTGTVHAIDLDGDPLTYGVNIIGLGTVSMNDSGRFIYIPSVEERSAAAATPAVDATATVGQPRAVSKSIQSPNNRPVATTSSMTM